MRDGQVKAKPWHEVDNAAGYAFTISCTPPLPKPPAPKLAKPPGLVPPPQLYRDISRAHLFSQPHLVT